VLPNVRTVQPKGGRNNPEGAHSASNAVLTLSSVTLSETNSSSHAFTITVMVSQAAILVAISNLVCGWHVQLLSLWDRKHNGDRLVLHVIPLFSKHGE
jgi:hypothetical protein